MKALILVDMQHDFMPGGALPVPRANEIVPLVNRLIPQFDHVVATQDWHPPHHISFASAHHRKVGETIEIEGQRQILWPDHCIQNTWGAELVSGLHKEKIQAIFHKGSDPKIDSYSTFFDNARKKQTGLTKHLRDRKITELSFAGVATDYCVLYSVLDALELGFQVRVFLDACRAIERNPGDGKAALEKMEARGAKIDFF